LDSLVVEAFFRFGAVFVFAMSGALGGWRRAPPGREPNAG